MIRLCLLPCLPLCVVLLALAGCGESSTVSDGGSDGPAPDRDVGDSGPDGDTPDGGGPGGGIGTSCATDADCESGSCIDVGSGRSVCTAGCGDGESCPAGWSCEGTECACTAGAEDCNGLDDDCDGEVDEGLGEDVGCDPAEACIDGSCGCPEERLCGARCIDTSSDPDHCGDCGTACAEGDTCADGTCCTPTGPETCNGEDDDCDGLVDEGTGEAVGCGEAELCVEGSCSCPPERTCGAACIDTSSDPEHCGDCATACAEGESCADGVCCAPSGFETCNGEDDDCDGVVDEGRPEAIGCGEGQLCSAGSCICPDARTCGDACVDTATSHDHCGDCDNACAADEVCDRGSCCVPTSNPVDILFMVDNSNSMAEEQASLAEAFPQMMEILASGDLDGDGTQDFPVVTDMHVGVVSSDMGTGGFWVPTCDEPDFGDDGILQSEGNTSLPGCAATYPKFLSYSAGDDVAPLSSDFECVARMGTGGCGFEQQLEAGLKAITPSTSPLTFHEGTRGHGDGENDGFLRDDSLLGIVMVTDEDDCSAADGELFNPDSDLYTGDLNLRCFQYPSALHQITRYVDGFAERRSDPGALVFSVIAGVPPDLVSDPASANYEAILADSRMQTRIDPENPTRLQPSCNVEGRGVAFPPRRFVQTAQELELLGANTVVQSICQADYSPALEAVATQLASGIVASCD